MNTNQELNTKIRQAFTNATPDILPSVLADCNTQKGGVPMKKKSYRRFKPLIAIAAALTLLIGTASGIHVYRNQHAIVSTVLLDVNPSIAIKINRDERVIDVVPRNEDGRIIIGDMDFTGSHIDVAVNALIGSMLTKGYLSEVANSILISVDGENAKNNAALQAKLTESFFKPGTLTVPFSAKPLRPTKTFSNWPRTIISPWERLS